MAHPLADRGTPRALAENRQVVDYEGDLTDFERLAEIVEADLRTLPEAERPARWRQAPVRAALEFGFADVRETAPVVAGSAQATLTLVCQRCLEPFELPLDVDLQYVLQPAGAAGDEQAVGEVWELEEDAFRPLDLVEESLIMALPMSASHVTLRECGPLAASVHGAEAPGVETVRPFAGLKDQLKDLD